MDRRALIAGAVSLPLLPAAGTAAQRANATDAAWAEVQAAEADFDAAYKAWETFDDSISDQIGPEPVPFVDTPWREYQTRHDAWDKARAKLPENPHQHPAGGEPLDRLNAARDALVAAPVATLTDLERKLSVAYHVDDHPEYAETILAGVRAMIGRSAS